MQLDVQYLFAPAEIEQSTTDLFTAHTRACEVCGATFQTCGKGKRCSRCLVGPGVAGADARITCRVCDAKATVALDWPALLCPECMRDLDATRDRVAAWLSATLAQLNEAQAQWQTTCAASAHWPPIQAALIAVAEKRATQAALDATWAKRKAEGGAMAALLTAYEGYAEQCDRLAEQLDKHHKAQAEINAAFLAGEV